MKSSSFQIKVAEEILDQAIMDNKPHYLIKWRYLPHQYDTWEPLQNLQCVVDMVQNWVRNKRQQRPNNIFGNASSFCDTVNYIDPSKKIRRKRKLIHKNHPHKFHDHQIVVVDEDAEQGCEIPTKVKNSDFEDDPSHNSVPKTQINSSIKMEDDLNIRTRSQSFQSDKKSPYKMEETASDALKYDPESQMKEENLKVPKVKSGMKVIGRVKEEDIENILDHFTYNETLCFKIQLTDGRVTNMREQDLKKLCPQMLMEYYEDKGIKI